MKFIIRYFAANIFGLALYVTAWLLYSCYIWVTQEAGIVTNFIVFLFICATLTTFHPISTHMVFSLLLTYLSAAVILFLLEIEFIAFLFIIIQSSAVVVLFTFTLMLFSIHFIEHRVIGKEAFYILGAVLPWTWISSKTLISIPSEVNYIEQFVGIPSPDIFFVGTLFTHYSAFVVVLTLILLLTTFLISHITN